MKKSIRKFIPKIVGFKLNSLFLLNPVSALDQAFYLFCAPRRGKVSPEQALFLDPAKAGKITLRERSVQIYHWKGNKETVLLLHGWESNTHRWKTLITTLQKNDYNVVACDAPAHGYSSGKLFNVLLYSEFVEFLVQKFSPAYLVGHSVGAMTAVYHQHKHPAAPISKMVLLGPPSEMTLIMKDFKKILQLSPRFMKALETYFEKKFGFTFSKFSTARFAGSLKHKGLIFHDKYDKIVPLSASENIHQNWSHSKLIVTEGAGHSLHNEAIHREIIRFLKQ